MAKQPVESGGGASNLTPEQVKAESKAVAARAALQTAANAAKKNPTPENVAAVKKAFAAVNAAPTVASQDVPKIQEAITSNPSDVASLGTQVNDVNLLTEQLGTLTENAAAFDPTVVPGSGGIAANGTRTLAKDTFANTMALLLGTTEAQQPWVNEMYGLVSGFYNSGSDIQDAINLSLYEAKAKNIAPQFTKRFAPVFKLQERLQKGESVTVPTVAEYIKSETDFGDVLREAGLGELATQEFIGNVLVDKSVLTATNTIAKIFDRIDNAPSALKSDLTAIMGLGVSRVDIAKALLTGKAGAVELEKKINTLSVVSAANTQGMFVDTTTAEDLAAGGATYGSSLTGFAQVKDLERINTLAQFGGGSFTQKEAIAATFSQNKAAQDKIQAETLKEFGRFGGKAGLSASALRGQNAKQQI